MKDGQSPAGEQRGEGTPLSPADLETLVRERAAAERRKIDERFEANAEAVQAFQNAATKGHKKRLEQKEKLKGLIHSAAGQVVRRQLQAGAEVLILILGAMIVTLGQSAWADENPFAGCRWIRGLDVPAMVWAPEGDKTAGPRWDGGLLVEPLVMDERVFYHDSEYNEWHFLPLRQLAGDPRETDWWESSRLNCRAKTLWGRVANAARSQDYPGVTLAIINDMIRWGVTNNAEVNAGKFTTKRLNEIMLRYSELVWD